MATHRELTLLNRASEVPRAQEALEEFARENNLPPRLLHAVQLAVEEHLTNIVRYAHADGGEHPIRVVIHLQSGQLHVQIQDDGRLFNPLDHPTPDLTRPIEERPIGGMGIHMIRQSLEEVKYRHENGKNILTMIKRITTG
jgi:anti-sigma regulatory factor (Ser/Thr protein kinase)